MPLNLISCPRKDLTESNVVLNASTGGYRRAMSRGEGRGGDEELLCVQADAVRGLHHINRNLTSPLKVNFPSSGVSYRSYFSGVTSVGRRSRKDLEAMTQDTTNKPQRQDDSGL